MGLSGDQLKYLAQAKGVVKASRRDLAPVMATKRDGATTVAGTIVAAELAEIPIFVTGGIGMCPPLDCSTSSTLIFVHTPD